jgi:hypothetical protein
MTIDVPDGAKKRNRSPSYPAIPLDIAIERARAIYAAERGHPTQVNTALRHWNYAPRSGAGMVTIAALIQFGLLESEGSGDARRVWLTDLAHRIIRDDRPESPERTALIRDAALRPPIHRELWERYSGSLPSNDNLRYMLKFDRSFTDSGADAFIRELRRTIEYANLPGADDMSDDMSHEGDYDAASDTVTPPPPRVADYMPDVVARSYTREARAYDPRTVQRLMVERAARQTGGGRRSLPLPILSSPDWPVLSLPTRITEADWDQMLSVLMAMKPGIVAPPKPESSDVAAGESEVEE